jgi:DNA-binding FadR family transcriptional regulator
MHELEAKHLVQRRTGRGTTVSEQTEPVSRLYAELDGNTDASLDDATELRLIVEPRIASAAALRSAPSNLVHLEDVLTRSALRLDAETSLQLDMEFHLPPSLPRHARGAAALAGRAPGDLPGGFRPTTRTPLRRP